nr:alpha-(1,3)-fucosyltransferase C-like isoform X1 [Cherax quadricarinatus]
MYRKCKVVGVLAAVTVLYLLYADLATSSSNPKRIINYGNTLSSTETGNGERHSGSNIAEEEATITQSLLPGDSDFPYEELSMVSASTTSPWDLFREVNTRTDNHNTDDTPLKKILYWNFGYNENHYSFGYGREPFLRAGCRVNTCMTTGNRSKFPLTEIDAVMWNFRSSDRSLPNLRSRHTRYVFFMMEPASVLHTKIEPFNNVFNWTMTYRLDSDLPKTYGHVYRRRKPLEPSNRNYAEGKTKFAAWFVSHCDTTSGRKKLVKTLRKWIKVDQYGHCSSLKCERKDEKKCYAMLASDYKFYFSFENSLCRDYVTEKLFNISRLDVIPVVYGSANYSQHAPPHSYIDALSFPTAKALADYLIYLNNNDTAYNEYFRWKRFHRIPGWSTNAKPFCDLCERLHTDNDTKVYNLKKWFVDDSHCKYKSNRDVSAFINGHGLH